MNPILLPYKKYEESFIEDLHRLISVDCGTENKKGVDQVGNIMQNLLQKTGFTVETIEDNIYGNLKVAKLFGKGQRKIMLLGHLDTVYPEGIASKRPMKVEGDIILGPGVCDMKGGLLTGVYAIRALVEQGFNNFQEIIFFLNSDEEIGSPISTVFYKPYVVHSDIVLVLEAARENGDIVSGRKGIGHYEIKVKGKAAHAGVEPERGINAILELANKIIQLQHLNNSFPGLTVNVGVISGGTKPNIISEEAYGKIDVRVENEKSILFIKNKFQEIASYSSVTGTQISIEGEFRFSPMEKTEKIAQLAQMAKDVGLELGLNFNDVSTGGASDANYVSSLGVPVLDGLGPVGGNDHSEREYILKSSICERIGLLSELIKKISIEG